MYLTKSMAKFLSFFEGFRDMYTKFALQTNIIRTVKTHMQPVH